MLVVGWGGERLVVGWGGERAGICESPDLFEPCQSYSYFLTLFHCVLHIKSFSPNTAMAVSTCSARRTSLSRSVNIVKTANSAPAKNAKFLQHNNVDVTANNIREYVTTVFAVSYHINVLISFDKQLTYFTYR